MLNCHICGAEPIKDPTPAKARGCPDCGQMSDNEKTWDRDQTQLRAKIRMDLLQRAIRGGMRPTDALDNVNSALRRLFG